MSIVNDMVDELLDMEGDIEIAGITFSKSYILKELDPIAYRELCSNQADSMIEDLQYDLDRLDPELDADEVEDLKQRIEELQDY